MDLNHLSQWAIIITAIIAVIGGVSSVVIMFYKLTRMITNMKQNDKDQEDDQKHQQEFNRIVIKGVHASLLGLEQLNANGPVTATRKEIDDYLMNNVG